LRSVSVGDATHHEEEGELFSLLTCNGGKQDE